MVNDYFHITNPKIDEYVSRINTYKTLFEKLPKLPQLQENLLRKSTLKSSLFSAKIEGNTLELSDVEFGSFKNREKKEVTQIFTALKNIRLQKGDISEETVCNLHSIVMDGLTSDLGRFRHEPSAIFNVAGVAVYMPPSPQKVSVLMKDLMTYLNVSDNNLSRIAIAHFAFEKIHPFLDGNGRVGRILMNWQLTRLGYGFSGLLSFEEYLEQNRERYYDALSIKNKDITRFVEFILEAIAVSSEKVILELQDKKEEKIEDTLLPRRNEILLLIREHSMMSFDQIKRRFLAVNSRTLHYDLQYLLRERLIKKLGSTKGTVYVPFQ